MIEEFIKIRLLDESERLNFNEWVQLAIESTTEAEFIANQHDLFYGFIGKALLILEYDPDFAQPFVTRVIEALERNAL
ncbi:MAG: hypothetical protein IPJ20_20835 [Flammeovirgaceae bacterium]|nr:hypothetical protein [Flammeovirgaceae bacterium]